MDAMDNIYGGSTQVGDCPHCGRSLAVPKLSQKVSSKSKGERKGFSLIRTIILPFGMLAGLFIATAPLSVVVSYGVYLIFVK